jgi:hypothetical protein
MTSSSASEACQKVLLRACSALGPHDWDGYENTLKALDEDNWRTLSALAVRHGLLGLVARGIDWAAERTGIQAPTLAELRAQRQAQLMQLMVHRRAARRVAETLVARGIRIVVYKGAVLAEEVYGDLSLRAFGDCDILVHPDQLNEAYDILQQLGYSPNDKDGIRRLIDRDQQGIAVKHADGSTVDLHWWIASGELLADDPDIIWRYCGPQDEPGKLPGWRMSPELTLIQLATHFCSHQFREFKPLVDFFMTAAMLSPRIRIDELDAAARALDLRQMIELAARLCERMFVPNLIVQRLCTDTPTVRTRLACAVLTEYRLLQQDSTYTVGDRLRRVIFGGTLSSSLKAFRRMLLPKPRELERRFNRPFEMPMYARYYLVQAHRLLTRSRTPFDHYVDAGVSRPTSRPEIAAKSRNPEANK